MYIYRNIPLRRRNDHFCLGVGLITDRQSPFAPFKISTFTYCWLGSLAVYHAVWMQNVGAAWLMTTLNSSALMVALVQTATALPSAIFGLPGGILADIVNRKQFLSITLNTLVVTAAVLTILYFLGVISPLILLIFTFMIGSLFALQSPSWFSTQVDSVPFPLIPTALALGSISFNTARAVGPAIAGIFIPLLGVGSIFAVVGMLFLSAVFCIRLALPAAFKRDEALVESPKEALLGLYQYGRHSSELGRQLLRSFSFVLCASALWALLPVLAQERLESGIAVYGYLMASLGVGAVIAALVAPKIPRIIKRNNQVISGILVFAIVSGILGTINSTPLMCFLLVFAGLGWQIVLNYNLTALQMSVASWIRGRSISAFMLVFQGGMAVGAFIWGLAAEFWSASTAMLIASASIIVSVFIAWFVPGKLDSTSELSKLNANERIEEIPEDLKVPNKRFVTEVHYKIADNEALKFVDLAKQWCKAALRDGAASCTIVHGSSDSPQYIIRLEVTSCQSYQRLQLRRTQTERNLELEMERMQKIDEPPVKYFSHV